MSFQRSLFPDHNLEMVVDSFAGGGGASIGISRAIGRCVDVAINHSPAAICMHEANHPEARHYIEDIWALDPKNVTMGRPVGLAWFSPDCRHHSRAKGGRPVKGSIRGLAWVVIRWAEKVRPRVICLENVEEFQDWGPLKNDRPIPERRGETFARWLEQLKALGYAVEYRIVSAHHYGAITLRRRLVLIARCDGQPIVWPEPTHGPGALPYRTALECIDWSIPAPSIWMEAKAARKAGIIRPLAASTMQRIERGLKAEPSARAFLIKYYGSGGGQSIDEPLHTITTKDRFALVVVKRSKGGKIEDIGMRMLKPRELAKAQGMPDDYILTGNRSEQVHAIGNSVCPVVAEVVVRANYAPLRAAIGAA